MATATFEPATTPVGTDVNSLSGAFVGSGRKYQMLAPNARATWRVRISGGTVRIAFSKQQSATLLDGKGKPVPRNLLSFTSLGNAAEQFTVVAGASADRVLLVAEDAKGKNLDTVTISIKTLLPKTFMIHRLANPTMRTSRSAVDIETMMGTVRTTYLAQANVELTQFGPVSDLLTSNEYGDPINLTNRAPRLGSTLTNQTVNFNEDVVDTLKRKGKFLKADFHMVSTCQMHGTLGVTPGFKNVCYVAHTFTGNNLFPESTTWAHELGHAFQLDHPDHQIDEMMAEGNVPNRKDSFIMTDRDIDKINPTGL